jgi:hypothetical protein
VELIGLKSANCFKGSDSNYLRCFCRTASSNEECSSVNASRLGTFAETFEEVFGNNDVAQREFKKIGQVLKCFEIHREKRRGPFGLGWGS